MWSYTNQLVDCTVSTSEVIFMYITIYVLRCIVTQKAAVHIFITLKSSHVKRLTSVLQVFQGSKNNTNADADALRRLGEFEASGVDHLDHHYGHEHLSNDGFFCSSPSEMNV